MRDDEIDAALAAMETFVTKYGHRPARKRELVNVTTALAKTIAAHIAPMIRRLDALEAEMRSGHARLRKLEGEHHGSSDN